jgi:hypothetical protein
MKFCVLMMALSLLLGCSCFRLKRLHRSRASCRRAALQGVAFDDMLLAAADLASKPDNYQYGAVAAPSWVLPLAAVAAILTAAVPILLRPGESVSMIMTTEIVRAT